MAGCVFRALHLLEGAEPGVLVVQAHHQAERDLVVLVVVEKAAAEGVGLHRPAGGVHHETGLVLGRIDFPEFLDAYRPARRITPFVELVFRDELLAQVAARAFGEDGVLGVQLHAELEAVGRLPVLADAQVAGGHALDRAVVVVEQLGGREAGEDLHTQRLGLLAHPAHHVAQMHDVVAVVVHGARQQPVGCALRTLLAEKEHVVARHLLHERCALFLRVGDQFGEGARVHHRTAEDVRTRLRPLLEHHHRDVLALFGSELADADRGGKTGRAATHHEHVVLHRFARAVLFEDGL